MRLDGSGGSPSFPFFCFFREDRATRSGDLPLRFARLSRVPRESPRVIRDERASRVNKIETKRERERGKSDFRSASAAQQRQLE